MKSANPVCRSEVAQTLSSNRISKTSRTWLRVAAFLFLVGLFAGSFYLTSSASSSNSIDSNPLLASNSTRVSEPVNVNNSVGLSAWASSLSPLPQTGATVQTFASDCMTPKTVFNLQDTDLTVCAKVTGFSPNQVVIWSNANFRQVQNAPVGTGESTFTLTATSSLGDWRVILLEPSRTTVHGVAFFTVVDNANPSADLTISKGAGTATVSAGSQAVFTVQVTNLGPSDATTVQITDGVPPNTTFSSYALVTGPAGINCVNPTAGAGSGDSICTIPTLARGETATFLAAYDVNSGVAAGTFISNSASVESVEGSGMTPPPAVPDPRNANNSSSAELRVVGAAAAETCTLDCPANVVRTANTTSGGQPGAFVTLAAATVSGSCGAVTNNPASGAFFPVGTHSVVSTSELNGGTCTFTVTILDSNPPTINCPANITVTAAEGASTANVSVGTPTINASGGGTLTSLRSDDDADPDTPLKPVTDPYPIGATGVTWTVTDAGGRTASCTQTITVVAFGDRDPVTISCPAHVNFNAPSGSCEATIPAGTIGTPTTVPSDSNVNVVARRSDDLPLSAPFPAGTTVITWTATDELNGSVASCSQNVTVTPPGGADTTAPTLHVPANVIATTASCSAVLDDELGVATAEDTGNCSGSNVNINRTGVPANFIFPTGVTTITYTATDAAGNTTTATQTVTVTETPAVLPTITAPADVSVDTGPGATSCGTVVSDAALGSATANDNCPGVTVTRTGVPAGNMFPVGSTTVTYRATDRSGNFTEDTQVVTVNDNTPPVVTPPANVTVFLPLNSTATSMVVNYPNPATATDNCPGTLNILYSPASGSTFPVGTTTVTASTTDAHGNPGSATFTVTVLYNFTGFFAPVDNLPTLNVVNAGKAVPVKFSLSGDKGLNIFAPNAPYTISINCDGSLPQNDIEETLNAGGSSLSYDAASDKYNYVWKTENSWKNTCRQLVVTLNDGSEHRANFKFK